MGRVRYAGANGRLTLRADSGFYTHGVVSVCRKMDVRFSITIRQHKSLRNLIEAIPEDAWTPIPYWMDGAADVAETTCTPFQSEPDAAPVRLIVRRVKPTPGSQLALFATYSYHGFITDRHGEMLELEADHRPPLPLSPVPLLHSHPFGGFGLRKAGLQAAVWGLICPAATEAVGPSGSARRAGRLCIIWTAVEPSATTPNAEGTVKLQELLDNPGTAAFSRIKYLQRYAYDDQVKEFINALFLVTAESRYQGDWQQLIDFLDHWDEVATDLQFQSMRMPEAGDYRQRLPRTSSAYGIPATTMDPPARA